MASSSNNEKQRQIELWSALLLMAARTDVLRTATIKDNDLARRREMLHIRLHVQLRLLTVGWR
jgi:hypothetical protein